MDFPLAMVLGLNRELSDHVPLHFSTEFHLYIVISRFETCWLEIEGFKEEVVRSWIAPTCCVNYIDKWKTKVRRLGSHFKWWHINVEGFFENLNRKKLGKLDGLDKKSETCALTMGERELKMVLDTKLKKVAHEKDLKEGDGNTRYFQLKASGRRKKTIFVSCIEMEWKFLEKHT